MASGRSRATPNEGEQFVRPLTDTIKDVEQEWQVVITTSLMCTGRRGELEVKMSATGLSDVVGGRPFAVVAMDWPHASVQSLPALLYNLSFKLGRMVEESRRDQDFRGEEWRV